MKVQKIYAVTPNPALDFSGHVQNIIPNEKNYVYRTRIDAGRNAINAARIIQRLGEKPILFGFLGGSSGNQLKTLLQAEGLKNAFTPIRDNTRTNFTVTNDENHQQTRLTFPGPQITATESLKLLNSIKKLKAPGIIIFGGSIPSSCSRKFYPRILRVALQNQLGVIVDVPAIELKNILNIPLKKLLLIKPNRTEFEALIEKKCKTPKEIAKAAFPFLEKSEMICVSLGKDGVVFIWNHQSWLIHAPKVHTRGCVGAGDSMVGGIVRKLIEFQISHPKDCKSETELLSAIRYGVAAGAATATTEGTSLGNASLIQRLYQKTKIEKLK